MQQKTLCAIYTRVSTDNQAEIRFNSCEAQKEKIMHFIRSQEGFSVYDIFTDEGFSGKDLKRPALQRMLKEIEKGRIDCVITYKMDRLTRSPKDFYHLIEHFNKYKADFISVTERFDTSTPAGRLLRNIMLTFAQFERELASERTKDKLTQMAQRGMWSGGTVPFGYKLINKKLIINKKEARIVKEICEMFLKTKSIAEVYNYLLSKGYKDRKGKIFPKNQITYILKNIIYTGKMKYAGNVYQGIHTAIITEEQYNQAQRYMGKKIRKWRQYRTYPYAGIVRCKTCERAMTPCFTNKKSTKKKKINRYYYYRCHSTFKKHWNSCDVKHMSADRFEYAVFHIIDRMSVDMEYMYNLTRGQDPTGRTGLEPNRVWSRRDQKLFQEQLKKFLKAAAKRRGTDRCLWIKKYVKDILYSKEIIQITMYDYTAQDNQEGSLGEARKESATRQQVDCGKSMDSKRVGHQENGRACRIDAGGVGDGPRRSAEGRSAGGHPASAASSGATEGVRLGVAERSSEHKKITKPDNFQLGLRKRFGSNLRFISNHPTYFN